MWYLGLVVCKIVRKAYDTSVVAGRPYLEPKIAHGSLGPLIVEFCYLDNVPVLFFRRRQRR
jgi:hypothetical protein